MVCRAAVPKRKIPPVYKCVCDTSEPDIVITVCVINACMFVSNGVGPKCKQTINPVGKYDNTWFDRSQPKWHEWPKARGKEKKKKNWRHRVAGFTLFGKDGQLHRKLHRIKRLWGIGRWWDSANEEMILVSHSFGPIFSSKCYFVYLQESFIPRIMCSVESQREFCLSISLDAKIWVQAKNVLYHLKGCFYQQQNTTGISCRLRMNRKRCKRRSLYRDSREEVLESEPSQGEWPMRSLYWLSFGDACKARIPNRTKCNE